jgi:cyclophilin family peptidyl-prolyl cis-trans isomerase
MKSSCAAAALSMALLGCGGAEKPRVEEKSAPKEKPKPPEQYRVELETTQGGIVIEVKREWAPRGADHFHGLVTSGFYDGVKFHRVLKQFIAQFGINGDPKINELYSRLTIPDDPVKQKNRRGTVTFAKVGPNSRTTEVFINLRDNTMLDSTGFAPFGRVVEGMDVAAKLAYVYGESSARGGGGPDPVKIAQQGNRYLENQYPRLDAIRKAAVIP